jgi:thioredoxin 1
MSIVHVITDREFATEVLQSTDPVLVYFWAAWCGPCRLMAPVLDRLANSYADRLKVIKMEVDPNPESVEHCQVEGVPAFRFFRDGKLQKSTEGAVSQQKLEMLLNETLLTT